MCRTMMRRKLINAAMRFFVGIWVFAPDPAWPGADIFQTDCPGRISCREEALSRTLICLDMEPAGVWCSIRGQIGGEHISTVRVRTGAGGSAKILFKAESGHPVYWIQGPDARVFREDAGQDRVQVGNTADAFDILFSAHPYGEFLLIVE